MSRVFLTKFVKNTYPNLLAFYRPDWFFRYIWKMALNKEKGKHNFVSMLLSVYLKMLSDLSVFEWFEGFCFISLKFIYPLGQPFPPNLQNIINHKLEKVEGWNFERMLTPHLLQLVTGHLWNVMCHVSHVMCHMSSVTSIFFDKVVTLIDGGYVISGAYPV